MPFLAAGVVGLFHALVEFLWKYLSKKVAIGAALAAVLVGGWVALQLAVYALWQTIGFVMPGFMGQVMGITMFFLPSNAISCLNALIVTKLAVWLWREQKSYAMAMAGMT